MNNKELFNQYLTLNKLECPCELAEQILHYLQILTEWNQKINLTAHRSWDELILKDAIDMLFLNLYIIPYISNGATVFDLGCGAGFAGIILKIMNPGIQCLLLDSDRRKINFVRQVIRELRLSGVGVLQKRVEQISNSTGTAQDLAKLASSQPPVLGGTMVDLVVTRATWSWDLYVQYASYYVQNNGLICAQRGPANKEIIAPWENETGRVNQPDEIIHYTIKPKSYQRTLYLIRKN